MLTLPSKLSAYGIVAYCKNDDVRETLNVINRVVGEQLTRVLNEHGTKLKFQDHEFESTYKAMKFASEHPADLYMLLSKDINTDIPTRRLAKDILTLPRSHVGIASLHEHHSFVVNGWAACELTEPMDIINPDTGKPFVPADFLNVTSVPHLMSESRGATDNILHFAHIACENRKKLLKAVPPQMSDSTVASA